MNILFGGKGKGGMSGMGCGKPGCQWCAKGDCWGGAGIQKGSCLKVGDWICPGCGDHQFAKNELCKQCSTPRPTEGISKKPSTTPVRTGDWICTACGDHQFAKNDTCKQCRRPRVMWLQKL